jgi:hypothetical protein
VIGALVILLPVAAAAAWAFFRLVPAQADPVALRRFNVATCAVALALAGAWAVRTFVVMADTPDAPWWPVIAGLGALLIASVVLAIGAACRGAFVFRRRAGPER